MASKSITLTKKQLREIVRKEVEKATKPERVTHSHFIPQLMESHLQPLKLDHLINITR